MLQFFLICVSFSSSERGIPAYWLNNWNDKWPIIGFWQASQDSWTTPPSRYPGLAVVRAKNDLRRNLILNDSFALVVDGVKYRDPSLFNSSHLGGCVQEADGELWTEYTSYNSTQLPVRVRRSLYLPPKQHFYIIKYKVTSVDKKQHEVSLLDFFVTDPGLSWVTGTTQQNDKTCSFDLKDISNPSIAVGFESKTQTTLTVGNGHFEHQDNTLNMFQEKGKLDTIFHDYEYDSLSFGANFVFQVSTSVEFSVFRAIEDFVPEAEILLDHVIKAGASYWITETKRLYSVWLSSGTQPNLTNGDFLDTYQKGLLVLKNSQNPQLGTISSSLHPLYDFKNWMRDSLMASFMLDAAGYHEEAKKFFEWVATAPLDDKGGFFTCYDTFTGEHAPFVEPQYDSLVCT